MKDELAALRTLILPYGATTGPYIVIDGVNGRIYFYDANNELALSAATGTSLTPDGDTIRPGFSSYDIAANTYARLQAGAIRVGSLTDTDIYTMLQDGRIYVTETGGATDGMEVNVDADEGLNLKRLGTTRTAVWNGADGFWYAGTGFSYDKEVWEDLPLQNGWTAVAGNEPQYKLDADGSVYLRGWATGGVTADNTVFAALPAGYRPAYNHTAASVNPLNQAYEAIDVEAGGNLKIFRLAGVAWISLAIAPFKVAEID